MNSVVSATFHFMHISTRTFIMTIQNIKVATAGLYYSYSLSKLLRTNV